MSDPTTRDLIQRLVDELQSFLDYEPIGSCDDEQSLVDEARAYLSQPEPEGPTDEDLLAAQDQAVTSFPPIHPEAIPLSAVEYARELEIRKARAVLARYAHQPPQPIPLSELADLAYELRKTAEYLQGGCGWAKALQAIERAATLIEGGFLQRLAPIPLSERQPTEADCNAEGKCWMLGKVERDWRLISVANSGVPKLDYCFSHWLPHWALPVPKTP